MLVNDILSVYSGHIIITKNGKTLYNSKQNSDFPPELTTELIWNITIENNIMILEI